LKAALVLNEGQAAQFERAAVKLLQQRHGELDAAGALDAGVASNTGAGEIPFVDVLPGKRESAAREVLEMLHLLILHFGEGDAEQALRASDGKSRPLGWAADFGPDQFAAVAPELAARLNRAYIDRTDRSDGLPLVPALGKNAAAHQQPLLAACFRKWRRKHRPEDVVLDDIEPLAKDMLRILGASDEDAVKNAFRIAYLRESMRDRRSSSAG
jgi:hypothetical protein